MLHIVQLDSLALGQIGKIQAENFILTVDCDITAELSFSRETLIFSNH